MPNYQPGEVIRAFFPYDGPKGGKPRPVLILSIISDQYYRCAMITGTNLSGKRKGEMISHVSAIGREMGLDKDSFINLENIKDIPLSLIEALKSPQGEYPDFDEFLDRHGIEG